MTFLQSDRLIHVISQMAQIKSFTLKRFFLHVYIFPNSILLMNILQMSIYKIYIITLNIEQLQNVTNICQIYLLQKFIVSCDLSLALVFLLHNVLIMGLTENYYSRSAAFALNLTYQNVFIYNFVDAPTPLFNPE